MTAKNAPACSNEPKVLNGVDTSTQTSRTAIIRKLNDRLRTSGDGGKAVFTQGVLDEGLGFMALCMRAVITFDDFNEDNDPFGEHDCASILVEGERIIWKIDYYDRSMTYRSPDPANEKVTLRVMTVMLASEY